MTHRKDLDLWRRSLATLRDEIRQLPSEERKWIADRLGEIGRCQAQMHALFMKAGGEGICLDCRGFCCDRAKYHLTLVNILPFLLRGEAPPSPDFTRPCPFLLPEGCPFAAGERPFNCISFLCDAVEDSLMPSDRELFYALEKSLRELYLAFDRRYAGSSLRGFLNRAERLGDGAFLDRLPGCMV